MAKKGSFHQTYCRKCFWHARFKKFRHWLYGLPTLSSDSLQLPNSVRNLLWLSQTEIEGSKTHKYRRLIEALSDCFIYKKKHDFDHTKVLGCPVQLKQILPSHMLAGVEPFYAGVLIQQQNGRGQGTGLVCGDSLTIYDLSSSILYAESKLTMHSSGFHSVLHCCRDFRPSYLGIIHNGPVYGSIWTNLHHVAPIFVTLSICSGTTNIVSNNW